MSSKMDKGKLRRLRRVLAALVELTSAMAEDFDKEYSKFKDGQLSDDQEAFLSLSTMRGKMVDLGGDAEPLLGLVSMLDKKFADAQYAKLLTARDIVQSHDEHYQAEVAKIKTTFKEASKESN